MPFKATSLFFCCIAPLYLPFTYVARSINTVKSQELLLFFYAFCTCIGWLVPFSFCTFLSYSFFLPKNHRNDSAYFVVLYTENWDGKTMKPFDGVRIAFFTFSISSGCRHVLHYVSTFGSALSDYCNCSFLQAIVPKYRMSLSHKLFNSTRNQLKEDAMLSN